MSDVCREEALLNIIKYRNIKSVTGADGLLEYLGVIHVDIHHLKDHMNMNLLPPNLMMACAVNHPACPG